MPLAATTDAAGTVWFDNPMVTIGARRLPIALAAISVAAAALLALVLLRVLAGGLWDLFCAPLLLLTAVAFGVRAAYRTRRPVGPPETPVRVGFSPTALHLVQRDGRALDVPWRDIGFVDLEVGAGLQPRMTLVRDFDTLVVPSINDDLAMKVHYAHRLARSTGLEPAALTDTSELAYPLTAMPPTATEIAGADPPVHVDGDSLVVWKGDHGRAFPREEVVAIPLRLLGKERVVVFWRDRLVTIFLDGTEAEGLRAWLGSGAAPGR